IVLMLVPSWVAARNDGPATPRVVSGWAMPNEAGTRISLHQAPQEAPGEGHVIAGAQWTGVDGLTHEGDDLPTCVGTDPSSSTRVQLGLVTVETPDGGVRDQVSWLECLE